MADTPRPFKKMAGRVEVHYFPKRPARRKGTAELQVETRSLTIPEFLQAEGEPERTKTPLVVEVVDDVAGDSAGRKKKGGKRRNSGSQRRRTTGEITLETDAPAPKAL